MAMLQPARDPRDGVLAPSHRRDRGKNGPLILPGARPVWGAPVWRTVQEGGDARHHHVLLLRGRRSLRCAALPRVPRAARLAIRRILIVRKGLNLMNRRTWVGLFI